MAQASASHPHQHVLGGDHPVGLNGLGVEVRIRTRIGGREEEGMPLAWRNAGTVYVLAVHCSVAVVVNAVVADLNEVPTFTGVVGAV